MCVIIEREPGVVIPTEKLDTACEINKHGFGILYAENGHLRVIRSLKNNDAKVVADHLQKLKNRKVWVHLRHATVGAVSKENSHPFILLSRKHHIMDLAMMHNGTLYSYKPTDQNAKESDTLLFAKDFVAPVALRFSASCKQKLLADEFFQKFLKHEVGFTSVVMLVDGNGQTLCINRDKGKEYDGWWASNDYSFQTTHYRHSSAQSHHSRTGWDEGYGDDGNSVYWWEKDKRGVADHLPIPWKHNHSDDEPTILKMEVYQKDKQHLVGPSAQAPDFVKVRYECQKVGNLVATKEFKHGDSVMSGGAMMLDLKKIRQPFKVLAGIDNLQDVGKLTETDLVDMAKDYPLATARLIFDLLAENSTLKVRNEAQRKLIRGKEAEDATTSTP